MHGADPIQPTGHRAPGGRTMLMVLLAAALAWGLRHAAWTSSVSSAGFSGLDARGLSTRDGFYYARLAENPPAEGHDLLRAYPDGRPVPRPLPLLPWLARLAMAVGVPLDVVVRHGPALLGALMVFPAFALGCVVAGRRAGVMCAVLSAAHPAWLERTSLGRFDTDGLILLTCTAGLASLWALLKALEAGTPLRRPLLAWCASLVAALWSWDQAPDAVMALFSLSVAGGVPRVWRRRRRIGPEGTRAAVAVAVALALGWGLTLARTDLPLGERLLSRVAYVTKLDSPAVDLGRSVAEQRGLGWGGLAGSQGGWVPTAAALAGLGLLARRERGRMGLLLPFALLAMAGAEYAARFALFATPLTLLGAAVGCEALGRRWRARSTTAQWLLVLAVAIPAGHACLRPSWKPVAYTATGSILQSLRETTRGQGMVHAWWDSGYQVQQTAGMPTAADGGWRSPAWLAAMSQALSAGSDSEARKHLEDAVPSGASAGGEWLLLDPPTLRAFPWILRLAHAAAGRSPRPDRMFRPFFQVAADAKGTITGSDGLRVRMNPWSPEAAGRIVVSPMPRLTLGGETLTHPDLFFVANLRRGVGVVLDKSLLGTLVVRLYYLEEFDPRFFTAGPREGESALWRLGEIPAIPPVSPLPKAVVAE